MLAQGLANVLPNQVVQSVDVVLYVGDGHSVDALVGTVPIRPSNEGVVVKRYDRVLALAKIRVDAGEPVPVAQTRSPPHSSPALLALLARLVFLNDL